jgi:Xaa-Pro dipeptidase
MTKKSSGNMESKKEMALQMMTDEGLDGLIVFSRGTISILSPSYFHYFAGFRAVGPNNAAVLTRSGKEALLVEPPWDTMRCAKKTWIKDVRGTQSFLADLLSTIKEFGLTGKVGIAGSKEMTGEIYSALAEVAKVEPADDIIEKMYLRKTQEEISQGRTAARIADAGFEVFLEQSRPGVREWELVVEMEYAMRAVGADDIFILLSSGPHNVEMHEPTDRRMQKGDVVIGEITPIVDGLFFQLCRTVVLGQPAPIYFEKYDMLLRALDESVKAVRTGAIAGALSQAMNRVITEAGYGKYCYPPYMRARGHGFGVGSIAPGGAIDDNTKTAFSRDQFVVIHPNQYIPETGYLACGETYLVTDTGAEKLAATETRLYTKEV